MFNIVTKHTNPNNTSRYGRQPPHATVLKMQKSQKIFFIGSLLVFWITIEVKNYVSKYVTEALLSFRASSASLLSITAESSFRANSHLLSKCSLSSKSQPRAFVSAHKCRKSWDHFLRHDEISEMCLWDICWPFRWMRCGFVFRACRWLFLTNASRREHIIHGCTYMPDSKLINLRRL